MFLGGGIKRDLFLPSLVPYRREAHAAGAKLIAHCARLVTKRRSVAADSSSLYIRSSNKAKRTYCDRNHSVRREGQSVVMWLFHCCPYREQQQHQQQVCIHQIPHKPGGWLKGESELLRNWVSVTEHIASSTLSAVAASGLELGGQPWGQLEGLSARSSQDSSCVGDVIRMLLLKVGSKIAREVIFPFVFEIFGGVEKETRTRTRPELLHRDVAMPQRARERLA